jgi:hypothetical protein
MAATIRRLDPGTVIERIVTALVEVRRRGGPAGQPPALVPADLARVSRWPAWASGAALLESRSAWWLWCVCRKGSTAGGDQLVMDTPPGRYLVDVLDTRAHAWVSRESAAGDPLVIGLPHTGHAILVRIRRVATAAGRVRE